MLNQKNSNSRSSEELYFVKKNAELIMELATKLLHIRAEEESSPNKNYASQAEA